MAEHYVLCVLSTINVKMARVMEYSLYRVGKPALAFSGYQTNEAPVQCLIKLAMENDHPVTGIICLTSSECNKVVSTDVGDSFSAKGHFQETIRRYYEDEGFAGGENPAKQDGFFIDVAYDGSNPSANLQRIIEVLDREDALIDIETTGGPRDAAFLLTNVVQFIEAKYGSSEGGNSAGNYGVGTILYTNLSKQEIYLQNQTFEISKLIHAIRSFTEFGKAEPLTTYFKTAAINPQDQDLVYELCEAIQAFADDLSLCRTKDVGENIDSIHSSLDAFEEKMKARMRTYELLNAELVGLRGSEAPPSIDDAKKKIGNILEPGHKPTVTVAADSRLAALSGFRPSGIDSTLEACRTMDDIVGYLENKIAQTRINRSIMLFMTLTDSLRNGIPKPVSCNARNEQKAQQTIDIIRWCTERGMLQQSLALYKERVPECLEQFGMIDWGANPPRVQGRKGVNEQKVTRVVQLSSFPRQKKSQTVDVDDGNPYVLHDEKVRQTVRELTSIYKRNEHDYPFPRGTQDIYKWRIMCQAVPSIAANEEFIRVKDEEHLPAVLAWFYMLGLVRNNVMHVDEGEGNNLEQYLATCECYFTDTSEITCAYDATGSPEDLKSDLLKALRAAEGKVKLKLKKPLERALGEAVPANRNAGQHRFIVKSARPDFSVEDVRRELTKNGFRMLVLGNGGQWSKLNRELNTQRDMQIVKALKVQNMGPERVVTNVERDAASLLDVARATVLSCHTVGDYITSGDVKDRTPFNDEASLKRMQHAGRKGSVFAKIAAAYPRTFQLVTCVMLKQR